MDEKSALGVVCGKKRPRGVAASCVDVCGQGTLLMERENRKRRREALLRGKARPGERDREGGQSCGTTG